MRNLRTRNCGPTASLLFGNLASNDKHVAYIHNTEVIVLPDSAVQQAGGHPAVQKLGDMNGALVQEVRWAHDILVVASQRSLQFYTADAKQLLHHLTAPQPASLETPPYFKGISACEVATGRVICAGTSVGSMCVQHLLPGDAFGDAAYYQCTAEPVVDLSAVTSEEDGLIASADGSGMISLFRLGQDVWDRLVDFPPYDGAMCTALQLRGPQLFCSYSSGHVRIFEVGLSGGHLTCEITAHARCINALEVHPSKPLFATAAEDCCINLWQCEPDGRIALCSTTNVTDALLTGLAFCQDTLAATAYDTPNIYAWTV